MTTTPPAGPDPDLEAAIDALGARHRAHKAEGEALAALAKKVIADALVAQWTPTELHRRTGYSRQGIDNIRVKAGLVKETAWTRTAAPDSATS